MEKLEPLNTVGGNVKGCSHYEKQHGGSPKIEHRITKYNLAILSIYPKELKAGS